MKNIHVSQPWFNYTKNNKKIVEGRLNKGSVSLLKKNDVIKFFNKETNKSIFAKIIDITIYNSFEKYLIFEGLKRTLPGINSIIKGVNVYYQYYTPEDEKKYGILAIEIKVVDYY